MRIYPDPDTCTRLDLLETCEFEIDYDRVDSVWRGDGLCCDGGQTWQVAITCPPADEETGEFDPYNTNMSIEIGCTSSCGGCEIGNLPATATCDPVSLTYGPFLVTASDLTCFCSSSSDPFTRGECEYIIEITEI